MLQPEVKHHLPVNVHHEKQVQDTPSFYWVAYPAEGVRELGVCFAVADHINYLIRSESNGINSCIMSMPLRLGRGT